MTYRALHKKLPFLSYSDKRRCLMHLTIRSFVFGRARMLCSYFWRRDLRHLYLSDYWYCQIQNTRLIMFFADNNCGLDNEQCCQPSIGDKISFFIDMYVDMIWYISESITKKRINSIFFLQFDNYCRGFTFEVLLFH